MTSVPVMAPAPVCHDGPGPGRPWQRDSQPESQWPQARRIIMTSADEIISAESYHQQNIYVISYLSRAQSRSPTLKESLPALLPFPGY